MEFSRQEYWSRLPLPPPGHLLTQGSNPHLLCLLHCRQILDHQPPGPRKLQTQHSSRSLCLHSGSAGASYQLKYTAKTRKLHPYGPQTVFRFHQCYIHSCVCVCVSVCLDLFNHHHSQRCRTDQSLQTSPSCFFRALPYFILNSCTSFLENMPLKTCYI